MCHVAHSKGCTPENLDVSLVEDLVKLQLSAPKPMRAPWYREGPRTEPFGRRSECPTKRTVSQVKTLNGCGTCLLSCNDLWRCTGMAGH